MKVLTLFEILKEPGPYFSAAVVNKLGVSKYAH